MTPTGPPDSSDDRDRTAGDRDHVSEAYDDVSTTRDERADLRDERADEREQDRTYFDPQATADRAAARRDRQASALDRQHARHDRAAAETDRTIAARERANLVTDGLTGAHLRAPGLTELQREIRKAARMEQSFVLAFVDVNGLKALNDSQGHQAGDAILRRVVDTLRTAIRDYDLLVRYGGDEFLCGVMGVDPEELAKRFETVNETLATIHDCTISVGLAALAHDDTLDDLIARADVAMYEARQRRVAIQLG